MERSINCDSARTDIKRNLIEDILPNNLIAMILAHELDQFEIVVIADRPSCLLVKINRVFY